MSAGQNCLDIPLLDLREFDAEAARRERFLSALRAAAHDVGFFYVIGHGIAPDLLRELLAVTRQFFALPLSDKLAIEMVNSPHFRGYNRIASELTRGNPDWREQIDIGPERPMIPHERDAPPWTRLQGPNQWPAALPSLHAPVTRWQDAAREVLNRLLRALALALGQAEDAFDSLIHDDPHYLVKLIRYPGRGTTLVATPAERNQGVGAHKDSELLTLLLQDDQNGLQVQTAGGWIDVPPRADTLVVNIGELLELASDGYLRATLHRVLAPAGQKERLSAAFFLGARLDATVTPLTLPPHMASHATGPERDPNNPMFREVGQNYLKGRLRSHPDVARRHYGAVATGVATGVAVHKNAPSKIGSPGSVSYPSPR